MLFETETFQLGLSLLLAYRKLVCVDLRDFRKFPISLGSIFSIRINPLRARGSSHVLHYNLMLTSMCTDLRIHNKIFLNRLEVYSFPGVPVRKETFPGLMYLT